MSCCLSRRFRRKEARKHKKKETGIARRCVGAKVIATSRTVTGGDFFESKGKLRASDLLRETVA